MNQEYETRQAHTEGQEVKPRQDRYSRSMQVKRRPVKVFRHGSCAASVFFNPVFKGGRERDLPSVSFAKLYKKHGLLKKTSSLGAEDLAPAILVLGQAHEWLKQLEDEESEGVIEDEC